MTIKLEAKTRELIGKKVDKLRQAGKLPAILFGHGTENVNLQFDHNAFEKIYREAGESTIIDLFVDENKSMKAIIADVQYDAVKRKIIHVDLHHVRMDEEVTASIELKKVGESRLVKEEGAVVVMNLNEIEIKCLPGKLIHEIEVDFSKLKDFDDVISIKDLKIPEGIEIVGHNEDDVIAMVSRPKEEEAPIVSEAAPAEAEKKEGAKTEEKAS